MRLAGSAFQDPQVVELFERFSPVLVDADQQSDLVRAYGVRGYPTVVFCDGEGNPKFQVLGAQSVERYRELVGKAVEAVGLK